MSQTYIAQIVILLAVFLPSFGVRLSNDQLTLYVQAVVILGGAAWTLYRRYKQGDITFAGIRK